MPQLKADLARLVAIPSISAPGYPEPRRPAARRRTTPSSSCCATPAWRTSSRSSCRTPRRIVTGEIPAPPGAPTVLLYSHYDVVPGRRRGAVELAAVRADRARRRALRPRARRTPSRTSSATSARCARGSGRPPVGIKVVIEGQEEVGGGASRPIPPTHPGAVRRRRDGDRRHGQRPPGRADADGRAARDGDGDGRGARRSPGPSTAASSAAPRPDALLALLRALASLHDENGDVAVAGLRREEWTGESYSDDEFRELAEVVPGLPLHRHRRARLARLVGPGDHGDRASTCRRSTSALNAVSPYARAKLNLRVHPEQDAAEAQAALVRHLEARAAVRHRARRARRRDRQRLRRATPAGRPTRRRARRSRRPGAATTVDVADAAGRSRSSARCRRPCPRPRCCSSARPTASRTSTRPTSACCSTSSRRRSLAEAEFFGELRRGAGDERGDDRDARRRARRAGEARRSCERMLDGIERRRQQDAATRRSCSSGCASA